MTLAPDNPIDRIFFALWPDQSEGGALAAWQEPLKLLCGGRAIRAEMLHATLVFIGGVEQARLEALQLAAQEVVADGFELRFDKARYWGHNHIVYAAPDRVPPQLALLVKALGHRLIRHRFRFDRREHKPHVTLLRNARWTDAPLPAMQPVRWQIRNFALVQSVHQEGPAGYRVLVRFPLDSSGG